MTMTRDKIDALIALLREIRPNYGDVGTRDVDVARQQKQIDRAIDLLSLAERALEPLSVPEGAAITAAGGIYYNIDEMKRQAEEAECVAMCLDDRGVPKADAYGKTFSLWGRVVQFAQGEKQ